jgi:REP element-mobilizing transposase RayT
MARPWRIQFSGAAYHVTARGNNRQKIFLDDRDKKRFLAVLEQAVARFRLKLIAFCLMDNHYHLFLRTPDANLSRAMHWINATYTTRFHRRHSRSGHLFQGRFKAVLVCEDSHWINLSVYVHLNPVRAGMAVGPADYEWSSFKDYTRVKSRFGWLDPGQVLDLYGASDRARRRRYREHCSRLMGKAPSYWEEFWSGVSEESADLMKKLSGKYKPKGDTSEMPEFMASRPALDIAAESERVARAFGMGIDDFLSRRRNNPARQAAYWLLVRFHGIKVNEAARHFDVGASAVSMGVRRVDERMQRDRNLRKKMKALCDYVKT